MLFMSCVCHVLRLFIAALWSPAGKGLTSWLLFVMFIAILLLSMFGILGQVWYLIVLIPDPCCLSYFNILSKVSKGAKIQKRYNQEPRLTQDTDGKVINSQLNTTNESQEVIPFPAGDHKAHINRRAQNIANTKQNKNIKDPQKKYRLGTVSKIFYWRA